MTRADNRYAQVVIDSTSTVEDYCILGHPPRGVAEEMLSVVIGAGAIIRSHTVIYAGVRIGERFQCGHGVLIRERTEIGSDCSVGSGSVIEFEVSVGDGVRLHSQCFVPEYSVLEDGCWLGPRVVLTNARYPSALRTKDLLEPVRVGKGAKIGANATILPGLKLGAGCLVGAGAVVVRDVSPGTIVVGNPAREIGLVSGLVDVGGPVY